MGDAVLHRIHVYKIRKEGLEKEREIKDINVNDNLRIYDKQILSPGHIKPFKFIGHARDPEKHSPAEVYLIDPEQGQKQVLFSTDGYHISGASTAVIFENHLYISQVFEPFILKVEVKN